MNVNFASTKFAVPSMGKQRNGEAAATQNGDAESSRTMVGGSMTRNMIDELLAQIEDAMCGEEGPMRGNGDPGTALLKLRQVSPLIRKAMSALSGSNSEREELESLLNTVSEKMRLVEVWIETGGKTDSTIP